jgi:mono/diheme cytochrome c family protein
MSDPAPLKAVLAAALVSTSSLGAMFVVGAALRRTAQQGSHQRPADERWFQTRSPPSAQALAFGRQLFLKNCAHCHAADAHGDEGPDLHGLQVSDRYLANTITRGIRGEMPSFAKKLDAASVVALIGYLRTLDPNEPGETGLTLSALPESAKPP